MVQQKLFLQTLPVSIKRIRLYRLHVLAVPKWKSILFLCFSKRLAKITFTTNQLGQPWYMISIHAIQFLIEIINWTSPILAGNFFLGINR